MHVNFFYWEAFPFNELVVILCYPPSDSEVKIMLYLGQGEQVDGGQDILHGSGWWMGGGRGVWPLVSSKFKILGKCDCFVSECKY